MPHQELTLAEDLKRRSHRIATLILNSDISWIDIELEINQMRELCLEDAPDKVELFEAVYVSRFNRLRDQWREEKEFEPLKIPLIDPERLEGLWSDDDQDEGELALRA